MRYKGKQRAELGFLIPTAIVYLKINDNWFWPGDEWQVIIAKIKLNNLSKTLQSNK